ncbi:hypothetical protein V500_08733 [Pseudogymnoascus sp. VKM F-4518 (FW-2643)]|nr:hypothetical protein V500_08733 [Pseudogymnoascus sp. VKM F-4518 (FW-2643)]
MEGGIARNRAVARSSQTPESGIHASKGRRYVQSPSIAFLATTNSTPPTLQTVRCLIYTYLQAWYGVRSFALSSQPMDGGAVAITTVERSGQASAE